MKRLINHVLVIVVVLLICSSVVFAVSNITNETRENNYAKASEGKMPSTNLVRKSWLKWWYLQ